MAETTGFTLSEIQQPGFTAANLAGLMSSFYAGTLSQVVDPGQGTRPPEAVFLETFFSGVGEDVADIGERIAGGTRDTAGALLSAFKAAPLILLVAGVVAVLVLTKKVG